MSAIDRFDCNYFITDWDSYTVAIVISIIISFFIVDFYITFYNYKKPIDVKLPLNYC